MFLVVYTYSLLLQLVGKEIIYSNAVLDTQLDEGEIKFFDSVKIPFQCRLSTNHTISQGVSVTPQRHVIMRVNGQGDLVDARYDYK